MAAVPSSLRMMSSLKTSATRPRPRCEMRMASFDDTMPAAHLAENGQRHVGGGRQLAQAAEGTAARRQDDARLTLTEQQRIRADGTFELDRGTNPRSRCGNTTFRQRHGQPTFADIVRR